MKKLFLLLCLLSIFTLCACAFNGPGNQGPAGSARLLGELDGSAYTNNVIGFSATVPEGWNVTGVVQMSRLFGGSAESLDEATSLGPESSMYIFYCSKYDLSYSGYNPGVGIEVSNQSAKKALLTGEQALSDYIEQSRESLKQQYKDTNASISYETGVKVAGNDYSVIHVNANYNGAQIMQDMYILGVNGYVMMITETYSNEDDKAAAHTFLESLKITEQDNGTS